MADFIGVHECTIDSKGRIIIPAPLKRQLLPFVNEDFVLKRSVFSPCLELYVMKDWAKQQQMVNKLNPFVKKNNDFKRMFFAGIKQVSMDLTGRILLAKDLLVYGKITKDAIMASAGDYFEIWDKEAYEKTVSDPSIDFGALAEEVMRGIEIPDDSLTM